jgi:hypothetical protein
MPGTLLLAQVTLAAASAAQAGEAAVGIAALCHLAMGTSCLEEGPALPRRGGKALFEGSSFQSRCGLEKAAQVARREAESKADAAFARARGSAGSTRHEHGPRAQECLGRAEFGEEVEPGGDLAGFGPPSPGAIGLHDHELPCPLDGFVAVGPSNLSGARGPFGTLQVKHGERGDLLKSESVSFEIAAEPGMPAPGPSGTALAYLGKVRLEDFPESGPQVFGDGRIRERDGPSRKAGAQTP